jgi:hypothetical protein
MGRLTRSLFVGLGEAQSCGELVGARCAFAFAIHAFQACYHVVNSHTFNKAAYALQVAVASTGEYHISYFAVYHVKIYES